MDNLLENKGGNTILGNWDWRPRKLKDQSGILLYGDLSLVVKWNDQLARMGRRLQETLQEIGNVLKKLRDAYTPRTL